jgi:tetratricopeptide (TPR) repeat protein
VLPAEVAAPITRHLETCALCKLIARDLDEVDAVPIVETDRAKIWKHIQSEIPPKETQAPPMKVAGLWPKWWRSWLSPVPIALAATAVILIGILFGASLLRRMRVPQQEALSTSGSSSNPSGVEQEPTQPAPQPSPPSAPGSNAFLLEKPPVRLPASAVMIWRGEEDQGSSQAKELEQALVPYRTDDYAVAEARLAKLSQKYPGSREARFYLGVCQLFLNKNQEAVASLAAAASLSRKPLTGETDWYLAIAYHRSGRDDDARKLLERLCRTGGKDSVRACAALSEFYKPHGID